MLVYDGLKSDFLNKVAEGTIAEEIENRVLHILGRHTPESEFNSWENSLRYVYEVIKDGEIPNNAGVAIEYNIPQTAKRVDFMISGYEEDGNSPRMVVIELKQWDKLDQVEGSDALVEVFTGQSLRQVVHPSYQAWSYSQLISDFNATVQDVEIKLEPCACLHNYRRIQNDPLDAEQYREYLQNAPAFTNEQKEEFRNFIKRFIKFGDDKKILELVDHGRIRPSKRLQDKICSMLKGNREFIMIDEQKVAFEKIKEFAMLSQKDNRKRVIICQGGPGTGKSVIAVNLLAQLTKAGQLTQYVSKNSAPRQVYATKLTGDFKKTSINNFFKGSGCYIDIKKNTFDTLLIDEAHRLNEKSGMMRNKGVNQIKEIIHACKCAVFFLDESQRVTIYDIGSADEIKKWAKQEGAEVKELELTSQFRCNGSDGYLAWVDDLLGIRETANYDLADLDFDVAVCNSPEELRKKIIEKNAVNNRSRILAGYCWEWPKAHQNDKYYHDIKIGDFEISWNLSDGHAFAISETSVNEAGCIHTTQGLEFDYVGVIIGDDMRYENGKIITDYTKRARTDQSLRGIKTMAKKHPQNAQKIADEIIRNTYRTLITRGMKGCYIYCTNKALNDYIRLRLNPVQKKSWYLQELYNIRKVAEDEAEYTAQDKMKRIIEQELIAASAGTKEDEKVVVDNEALLSLYELLCQDDKLVELARVYKQEVFVKEKFSMVFKSLLLDEYAKNRNYYNGIFEDKDKYCEVLGNIFYKMNT